MKAISILVVSFQVVVADMIMVTRIITMNTKAVALAIIIVVIIIRMNINTITLKKIRIRLMTILSRKIS